MATPYFRKRTSIAQTPFMSVTNLGKNWNVNAGAQSSTKPTGMLTTDQQMEYAVQARFYNRAVRLAPTRHGAIYDVRVNNDVRASLQQLRNVLMNSPNNAAYVDGSAHFSSGNVLVSVAHMSANKPMEWNAWLRYRVREAKMHRALDARVASTQRTSRCSPVPLLYFAGVDHTTGLYYAVMHRPPGTLNSIATIESKNLLNMDMYRAVEAAIGSLWYAGAMLSDTSTGNILITSNNHVVIPDFDSALVIPPGLKDRLHAQLNAFYMTPKKFRGPCRTVHTSQDRELVNLWDFVMRESSNRPSLQRLAVDVFGRRRWFPDLELLRTLKISSRADRMSSSGLRQTLASLGSGGGLRDGLRGLLARKGRENNSNAGSKFLNVRLRKIGALSEDNKKVWRRRQRRPKEPRERRGRMVSAPSSQTNVNLPIPQRPFANTRNTTNNNHIPMPSSGTNGTRRNNNNNTRLPNGIANLVAPLNTSVFQQGLNFSNRKANANANATKKYVTPPTEDEFARFTDLPLAHQSHLIEQEIARFVKSPAFSAFEKKLTGGPSYAGTSALNAGIREKNPSIGWAKMSDDAKRKQRKKDTPTVATALVRKAFEAALEMNLPTAEDRDAQATRILDTFLKVGWGEWFMTWVKPRR